MPESDLSSAVSRGGILCSGAIVCDIVVWPANDWDWGTTAFVETIEMHAGGNGANSSLALGVLGAHVRVLGVVGRDSQAGQVLGKLRAAGVDTGFVQSIDAPTPSTLVLVNSEGNRKFLHRPGASAFAFSEPVDFTPELIEGVTHYHMASFFILPAGRASAPETLRRARAAGLATSFDTNWDPRGRWMADVEPCLPHVDTFFANEDEARMLTGSSDPRAAAEALLARGAGTAVMKLGPRGCAIYTADAEVLCPAFAVEVKDTTGAGDCFVAGFLAARLRGASLLEAGRFANAVGALSVQKLGAATGVLPFAEVERWMRAIAVRKP